MKSSMPISESLSSYFTNPCPVLSDNNARMLLEEMSQGYDYVVEYGMGASTLYCLQEFKKHAGTFISVENNFDWFQVCIKEVQRQEGFKEVSFMSKAWSWGDIQRFISAPLNSKVDVPENLSRVAAWQESLATGPFFRFSPKSNSRFSGKLGVLWVYLFPIFKVLNRFICLVKPKSTLRTGEWVGKKDSLELILRSVGPSIKDQFGEAPNMPDYINAGLKDIVESLENKNPVSAVFMIDGGPRHKIVQEILKLEDKYDNFKPTIILCDASRVFYHTTLDKRPSGKFIAGSNKTLKGDVVEVGMTGAMAEFWTGGDKTGDELSKQEVWYYAA